MNIQSFFVKHPVYAIVLNVFLIVVGALSYTNLSTREYPDVILPQLTVKIYLPNATPELMEREVTFPLEQALSSVEGVDELFSKSFEGTTEATLKFVAGIDLDRAVSNVRDKISGIRNQFPKDILEPTISKNSSGESPFLWMSFENDKWSYPELTHFVNIHILKNFNSIKGVSSTQLVGQFYQILIKIDPVKMATYGVQPRDLVATLEANRYSVPGGKLKKESPVLINVRPGSLEDMKNLLVRRQGDNFIYLRDVADISFAGQEDMLVRVNGKPGVLLGLVKAADANPLEVSRLARGVVEALQHKLSSDITMTILYDQSSFIRSSLHNIQHAIVEAIIFVLLVIFLFLGSFRASLIPLVTIPIALVGAFFILQIFGYSINVITLLALVLAIGLVVDDAVVVLENVHRHMKNGLSARAATDKGGAEISFAVVAMTLTLASVYIPLAFSDGALSQIFREFAVALAGAVVLSGIVALTLTPVMCSRMLRTKEKAYFPKVDNFINKLQQAYQKLLTLSLMHTKWVLMSGAAVMVLSCLLYSFLPHELSPAEDRSVIGVHIPPLDRASVKDFDEYVRQVENEIMKIPGGRQGLSIVNPWGADVILPLKDWGDRQYNASQLKDMLQKNIQHIPTIDAWPWSWDSGLPGIDQSKSDSHEITLYLQTMDDYAQLFEEVEALKLKLEKLDFVASARHNLKLNVQSYEAVLDRKNMHSLDITPLDISYLLQILNGGLNKTTFQKDNAAYDVKLENGMDIPSISMVPIVGGEGVVTSLGAVVQLRPSTTSSGLPHLDQMRSAQVTMELKKGFSLGDALQKLDDSEVLDGKRYAFDGAAKIHGHAKNTMLLLIILGLIFIYGILSIQFESFIDPFIIILTVPLGFFGALLLLWIYGQSMNIFSQIGLLTLIGLITKHGILLVNFANDELEKGKTALDAIILAGGVRFKPILMTTSAMLLGIFPLVLSSGAGAEARQVVAYTLLGGLSFGTLLTLFFIPTAYVLVKKRIKPV